MHPKALTIICHELTSANIKLAFTKTLARQNELAWKANNLVKKLMTHKDIVEYFARKGRVVSIEMVIGWGADGLLGNPVIPFPKHYETSDVLRRLKLIKDKRVKLTDEQVVEILERSVEGERNRVLAAEYGVHESLISRIIRGERRVAG